MKTAKQAPKLPKLPRAKATKVTPVEVPYIATPEHPSESEVLTYLKRLDKQQKKILTLLSNAHVVSVPEQRQLRRIFGFLKGAK